MMTTTVKCPRCRQDTAYFDPVERIYLCPCGWRDDQRRTRPVEAAL